ncbi:hypothetical protein [Arthrobacter sp. CP30]
MGADDAEGDAMQDAALPASARAGTTLLAQADAAADRLGSLPSTGTGIVTIVVAAFGAAGLTLMLSDVHPSTALPLTLVVLLALILLTVAARRARSTLPRGWDRRLGAGALIPYLAVFVVDSARVLFGVRPGVPVWGAVVIAAVLMAPLAASGLWLVRRRPALPPSADAVTSNPFVVLAALASVDGVGLRALREATGMPAADLDRILDDFDRRELVNLGWGGSRPGLSTPVSLTKAGATAYADLRARLGPAAEHIASQGSATPEGPAEPAAPANPAQPAVPAVPTRSARGACEVHPPDAAGPPGRRGSVLP